MKLTTARVTGLFYLGMAVTGMLAYLLVSQDIYVNGDASATGANLVEKEGLARFGISMEVALAAFQALTAVWFFKLFRKKNTFGAGLIAVFGMVNTVAILIATAMWIGALNAALVGQFDQAQSLYDLHENIWLVAGLFFGLWLMPMGYMAKLAKFPIWMVWFLVAGGVGYVLSVFAEITLPDQTALADVLPMPATVGEFWMVGYLLFARVKE